ncbi:tRNA-dihydrouridine synthase [Halosegnis longus]|uniref:tRNA-dihydrouridine synthase n=1 Tax=Halosegnis longus TaxID=2216012 RepID=UPI00096A7A43|nr:tRNA-dihydrouridine synthase [Salella cibi]
MFTPPLALASLSGEADAAWAEAGSEWAGCAFVGGVSLDASTREAARELVARDRSEFLPADPIAFIDDQLAALADVALRPGVNVRATSTDPLREAARVAADRDAILEVNAHCRQEELCAVGAGETLLRDTDRLREYVRVASETGAAVGVKLRAETGVDLPTLASDLEAAGADCLHVDCMDTESVVGAIADACDCFLIANNGVRDRATVREYLDYGADAVSVGRPSDSPRVLERVHDALPEVTRA